MKKATFVFIYLSFLLISACRQEAITDELILQKSSTINGFSEWFALNKSRLDEVTRLEITSFESVELQKAIFNILTPIKQSQIWIDRMIEIKKKFNKQDELSIINDLIHKLQYKDFFDHKSPNRASYDTFLNTMSQNARSIFGEDMARDILTKLDTKIISTSNQSFARDCYCDCDCNTSSDWCPGSGYCQEKLLNNCREAGWGCGTFWWYNCNGDCTLFNDEL